MEPSTAAWNEKLQEGRSKVEEKRKRERRLEQLTAETKKQQAIAETCLRQLRIEQEDVEKLNSLSLSQVWYRLTGKLEERITEEEREAVSAQLKYDAAQAALQALENEREEASRLFGELANADQAYEQLLRDKEEWIRSYDPDTRGRLEKLTEDLADLHTRRREVQEAVDAGSQASIKLAEAEDKLNSAHNWGTYDMLGGGMIATAMKHSRIDEARDIMHTAQHALRMFEKELADLNWRSGAGDVEMDGFLTFADYFFDGFLTDWVVQGRINEALDKVRSGQYEVSAQRNRLAAELETLEGNLADKQQQYKDILENA